MVYVRKIITHSQPHLDELVAIVLLIAYGKGMYPGANRAKIEFWGHGGLPPDGRTAEDYESDGVLLIGVGGGRFDEHPGLLHGRIENESATSLVAKALKIHRRPEVRALVKYTTKNDLEGAEGRYELAEMVRKLNRVHPDDPMLVYRWVKMAIEAELTVLRQFYQVARIELAKKGILHEFQLDDKKLKLVSIQTDAEQAKAYAFSTYGGQVAVVVQRNTKGQIQVFVNKSYGLDINDVAVGIRLAELSAAGIAPDPERNYAAEGRLEDGKWFYFLVGQMLLNGSMTAPDALPSQLTLERVTDLVLSSIALKPAKVDVNCEASG